MVVDVSAVVTLVESKFSVLSDLFKGVGGLFFTMTTVEKHHKDSLGRRAYLRVVLFFLLIFNILGDAYQL